MPYLRSIIKTIKNNRFFFMIIQYLLYVLVRLLFATYRLKIYNEKKDLLSTPLALPAGIYYFWHQQLLAGMYFFSKIGATGHCIISPSKDGQLAAFIAQRLNFSVLFGSAHKNPITLTRHTLQLLAEEKQLCVVGDGSRGPAFRVQRGLQYLSKKAKVPLVFIECKPLWAYTHTKSWDQCQIPLPFSTIEITVHQPTFSDALEKC